MISFYDIDQILRPIRTKLFLMVGRCILEAIQNDNNDIQRVDITCLKNEKLTKRERLQEYGLETYPPADGITEGVALFINGNRDQGIVLTLGNRKYRPTDLNENEVCLYSKDSNDSNQNRITIKPDNTIEVKTADGNIITVDSNGIIEEDSNGNKQTMSSTKIELEFSNGNKFKVDASGITMLDGTEAFVKGTTHKAALTALTSTMAAIVPAGSSAANIAAIQAAFATFAGTLATMNSTEIKGK